MGKRGVEFGLAAIAVGVLAGCGSDQVPEPRAAPEVTGSTGVVRAVAAAPVAGRMSHVAVWSGSTMIIWGGVTGAADGGLEALADGAAYDPATDTWESIAAAPIAGRSGAAAVWTGALLYVWGGFDESGDRSSALGDGASYDPVADVWTVLPESPIQARADAVAVWTGDELLVWGGRRSPIREAMEPDGAAFDPVTRTWRPITAAPLDSFYEHGATWTGTELVVLAGTNEDTDVPRGLAYDPAADSWRALAETPIAKGWAGHLVWDGAQVLSVFPFDDPVVDDHPELTVSAAYDPSADTWTALPTITWEGGHQGGAVWTGDAVAYWTGNADGGSAYVPAQQRWVQLAGEPDLPWREFPSTVWTGTELIAWGGSTCPVAASCVGLGTRDDGVALELNSFS